MIPPYLQAAVLGSCRGVGLMTVKTQIYVAERLCFITGRDLTDILPGRPFYVYNAKLTAKPGICRNS